MKERDDLEDSLGGLVDKKKLILFAVQTQHELEEVTAARRRYSNYESAEQKRYQLLSEMMFLAVSAGHHTRAQHLMNRVSGKLGSELIICATKAQKIGSSLRTRALTCISESSYLAS